ncbi:uncharacterized protein Nmag_1266 [Natrialba magadii ATCC 43099]|uniref:Uncharacterized protein n=1 Tax=Natrialba magadii (strain ATCC 43099 / DSM 3394 / CCM 3739 / CIP 104546 / IAM 13178 / JCM 8861 / NBRC 102185 / NCIMB 2190 / MS3) TaxID=547559 RepID=D3SSC0_NATMM|nr:uncharacterized protein Nmag_1266 [Natrialba magadii ATCC 43099]
MLLLSTQLPSGAPLAPIVAEENPNGYRTRSETLP